MTDPIYPDFLATANRGYQTGQNMLATRLEGQAINGQGPDRQNALSSLAGVNPQASMALSSGFQQQQQAQDVDHAKKLNGAANYILSAVKTNNPAQIQGAWQNVKPYLEQLTGKAAPDQFDPAMLPAIYQAAGQSGGMSQGKTNVLSSGAELTDEQGNVLHSNPAAGPKPQLIQTADGGYVWATPGGGATPVTYGGGNAQVTPPSATQPPSDPMTPFIAQANDAIKMGAPEEQVKAWLMQKAASMGGQPIAPADQSPEAQNQAMKPTPMGQQGMQLGAPVMGPQKGAEKAPTGYQFNADRSSLIPIPGGPADKGQAASPLGDPNQTGEAYLSSIQDPAMESMVKAVAEGRMPLPKIYRSGKAGEIGPTQIAQAVAQYDPTYDQADPTSRIKARNDFTSGKSAVQLRQLNTLLGHLGGLADAADKLDNTGNTLVNRAENAVGSTYNTKVSNFNAAAGPAAEEFAALLKGGVPSVEEIKSAQERLNANMTPDQIHGSIGTMAAQIQSRIAALHAQAQNSLGPFANKVTIITPEGQAALDKLRERGLIGKFDQGEAGGTPQQSIPPASGGWSIQRVQ